MTDMPIDVRVALEKILTHAMAEEAKHFVETPPEERKDHIYQSLFAVRQWLNARDYDEEIDNYFGVCPYCRKHDGYINVGRSHWFLCDEHKVKWCVGSNLFSSWKDETEEQQRAAYDARGVGGYNDVAPCHPEECPERQGPRRPPESQKPSDGLFDLDRDDKYFPF